MIKYEIFKNISIKFIKYMLIIKNQLLISLSIFEFVHTLTLSMCMILLQNYTLKGSKLVTQISVRRLRCANWRKLRCRHLIYY